MSDNQTSKVRICGMAPAVPPCGSMWSNSEGLVWTADGKAPLPPFGGPWLPWEMAHPAAAPRRENVEHPAHYNSHPSGVECLTVVRHMNFNIGNAMKYLWRCDEKGDPIENLRKAAFYINDEIKRREASNV